jgi:hypothetical protein
MSAIVSAIGSRALRGFHDPSYSVCKVTRCRFNALSGKPLFTGFFCSNVDHLRG